MTAAGITVTPLAIDEFNGPRGDKNIKYPAGRPGTADDIANVAELRAGARPELKTYLDNLDGYDIIFVCSPNWWGTYPMAVFSQLERLDFTGKKVLTLMTHEGSGLGRCESDLKKLCTGASFGKGLAVYGSDAAKSEAAVAAWAKDNV